LSAVNLYRYLQQRPIAPVYLYRDFENISSLPFYLKKYVVIIDSQSNDL